MVRSPIRLPNFIVLAYLEVPKVAKPGPTDTTDRPTEFAIAICHLANTKCHKNQQNILVVFTFELFRTGIALALYFVRLICPHPFFISPFNFIDILSILLKGVLFIVYIYLWVITKDILI